MVGILQVRAQPCLFIIEQAHDLAVQFCMVGPLVGGHQSHIGAKPGRSAKYCRAHHGKRAAGRPLERAGTGGRSEAARTFHRAQNRALSIASLTFPPSIKWAHYDFLVE